MRLNTARWIERYLWLQKARDAAIFAQRRAHDVKMAQVAGSLTFTTTLTIVPLFAVALALFTAFPLFHESRSAVESAVLKALPGEIADTVLRYINEFALKATRLTAVGLVVLAVASIAIMNAVDRVLNNLWRVKKRRPLTQRVLIYFAIVTLSPLLIGASLTASSYLWTLSHDAVRQLPTWLRSALDYAPLIISGFAYAALYVFVPNGKVAWRDALVGGFIAAVLSELLKVSFGVFVSRGIAGSIYGAFAVLPLFLIWIYLSWYALLFGAAIAASLPRLRATRFSDELRAGNQFVTAVALLKILLDAKRKNRAESVAALARQARTSADETEELLAALERLGYARQSATPAAGRRGQRGWVLACDDEAATLKPAFERFAVDPANTLLSSGALGLNALRTRWDQSDWLNAPLSKVLV